MTRVTDFAQHNQTLANMLKTQERFEATSLQISSGKTAQRYRELALQDTSRLIDLRASHTGTEQFVRNVDTADQRLQFMEVGASTIFNVANQFRSLLINGLNMDNAADLTITGDARAFLETVSGQLNVRHEGRYLFAGTRTDVAPVAIDNPAYMPAPVTVPTAADTNYFQGDAQRLTVRADADLTVTYGVTADEPGFEKIMRALKLISVAGTPPSRDELEEALRVTNEALDDIPRIVSSIGSTRRQLADVKEMHTDLQLYVEGAISDIENVDVAQAFSRLTMDQTILEASFSTISIMRRLTLTNYL